MLKLIEKINEVIFRYKAYPSLKARHNKLADELITISGNLELCEKRIMELQDWMGKMNKEKKLEEYWNNKRKKVNKQWKARDGINMDVRCFFQRDCTLRKFTGTNDEIARKALGYVIAIVQYKSDIGENWQYSYETMERREGDCEDGGIWIANMMWNSGVPYWRIRLNKGDVKYKGKETYHAWCTYLAEDGNWYVLDWCYHPLKSVNLGLRWKESEDYLSCDCSWNSKYSFGGLNK